MAELLSHLHLHAVGLAVEIGLALAEEPVHAVAHARSDIKVLQKGEIRKLDGEVVGHTVLELVQETRLAELRRLEIDLVLQGRVVAQREFLVDAFLADPVLSLERVESRHRESNVRKRE